MMKFLKEVASIISKEHGSDLANHILVFPNRRSSLFFTRYLATLSEKPVWAPQIFTINDLLTSQSDLTKAEPLALIFELYSVYKEVRKASESFDDFYFWGEMLINDFDDIDKYLVDAAVLFQNLLDLREIEDRFSGYDPEILEIIRKFWVNFDHSRMTSEKSDFLAVWEILFEIYSRFRETLRQKSMGYDGMIIRDLVEKSRSGVEWTKSGFIYHFIGFNALNKCEQVILDDLKRRGKARFYWDYDELYTRQENHEAGFFLRDNIKRYGDDMLISLNRDSLLNITRSKMDWKVINAPSDVAQAKLIPSILEEFGPRGKEPDQTAIVLADENMMTPVLNSIPAGIDDINITMGYPLYQTPVYSLIHHLIRLQKSVRTEDGEVTFYYSDVLNLLKHQYLNISLENGTHELIAQIREYNMIRVSSSLFKKSDSLSFIFKEVNETNQLNGYLRIILMDMMGKLAQDDGDKSIKSKGPLQMEYIYSLLTSINQLDEIISGASINFGIEIYGRILDKIIRKIVVPFSGEPLSGLQVMGILETRLLDFENLIIISVNEGVLPKGSAQNSYIPYNLRVAFGLPTVKHQDSIYAYYFYRLLQRSKRVRFIYNSSSAGLRTGEMSRFLLQLKYNNRLKPEFVDSRFVISPSKRFPESISRDRRVTDIINNRFIAKGCRGLSPSAVNMWINCPMRFYYRYIAGLKEPEDVTAEIDSPLFGNILHESMNQIYSTRPGSTVSKDEILSLRENSNYINRVVTDAFRSLFLHNKGAKIEGRNVIIVSIIEKIVKQILLIDSRLSPVTIIALEKEYRMDLSLKAGGVNHKIHFAGTIDRVDQVNGVIRILDYKSGNDNLTIKSFEEICNYDAKGRNSAAFQTLLYCELYLRGGGYGRVRPALYPVRQIFSNVFSDCFNVSKGPHHGEIIDYMSVRDDFMLHLQNVIADIINPDFDFVMTQDRLKCKYCPYAHICDRED